MMKTKMKEPASTNQSVPFANDWPQNADSCHMLHKLAAITLLQDERPWFFTLFSREEPPLLHWPVVSVNLKLWTLEIEELPWLRTMCFMLRQLCTKLLVSCLFFGISAHSAGISTVTNLAHYHEVCSKERLISKDCK